MDPQVIDVSLEMQLTERPEEQYIRDYGQMGLWSHTKLSESTYGV